MNIAVPKETLAGETRVAVVPDQVKALSEKNNWSFFVQAGDTTAPQFGKVENI